MRTYADMTFEEVMEAFADTVTRLAYLRMGNERDCKGYLSKCLFEAVPTDDGISRSSACEAFAQVEDVQERNELYELMELVPNHRNALYLYYYEGYSIREISRLMNARENTVKSWMRRGKQELRSLLGGEEDA